MREAMEDVLYANGVDVILNGHLHVYERSYPVYVSSSMACVSVHWFYACKLLHFHFACAAAHYACTCKLLYGLLQFWDRPGLCMPDAAWTVAFG